MPGARCARSLACSVENTRVSHHGHTGNTRHSPRNGFTAYSALSPVTGLFCHRRLRNTFRTLDTSVGVSGPHDFSVRKHLPSSEAPLASTASRPASVTIAIRPSSGARRPGYRFDLGQRRSGKFFQIRLDRANQIELLQQIQVCAHAIPKPASGRAKRTPEQIIQLICPAGKINRIILQNRLTPVISERDCRKAFFPGINQENHDERSRYFHLERTEHA
jgi:hypothetical protein